MKRSSSVTAAAVVLLLGSAILILIAIVTAFAMVLLRSRPSLPIGPAAAAHESGFLVVTALFYLALAGWGVATAVGTLRLRSWARISILVMSVIATIGCLGALLMLLIVLPSIPGPQDAQSVLIIRVITFGTLGVPGAVAIWWLLLFTRPRVKKQFEREPTGAASYLAQVPFRRARPISITVISIMLLWAVPGLLLMTLTNRFFWPSGFPAWILGAEVTGHKAMLVYVGLGLIEAALGLGLWRMKPWARTGTIAFCVFSLVNAGVMALRPETFTRTLAAFYAANRVTIPEPVQIPAVVFEVALAFGAVLILLAVWFLVRHKAAFGPFSVAENT
jgi:hypothetical protein